MINEKENENKLRLLIDTLLLGLTIDQQEHLDSLCDGNDAGLNDAQHNYNDEMQAYRPNNDDLQKYLDAINAVINMHRVEIIVAREDFKKFLTENKNNFKDNSWPLAKSKNYDSDGLEMVIDYDQDHYSLRIENFDTSDIEFEHFTENDYGRVEKFYDAMLMKLINHIGDDQKPELLCILKEEGLC